MSKYLLFFLQNRTCAVMQASNPQSGFRRVNLVSGLKPGVIELSTIFSGDMETA